MFFETIRSEGLAHLSYIFGENGQAVVIDPRRDCELYVEIAHRNGACITHIFETHRNEDYVIGSRELARRTGAEIYHGGALDFAYGNPVSEGDRFDLDGLFLTILETPGHTYESISIALHDPAFGEEAVGVFTGDALFIGDVGRTDFFPDKKEEVAGLLFDSIFKKLISLGDHVILYPAHGAGSVCGSGMASREFSTLGYERLNNPALQHTDRQDFIQYKVNERHYQPPYFRKMEEYNQQGNAPDMTRLPTPPPMNAGDFAQAVDEGMTVLDIRSPEAIAGAFIPGSLTIPLNMVPAYGGWFLDYDTPIGIVPDSGAYEQVQTAVKYLIRMGYDGISGYLEGGLHDWETSARHYGHIPAMHIETLRDRISDDGAITLLDVRKHEEFNQGHLAGAQHVFLGYLPEHLDEVPKDRPVVTFCGSGRRAIIAASILKRNGFDDVSDCLGSMSACKNTECPIETPAQAAAGKE